MLLAVGLSRGLREGSETANGENEKSGSNQLARKPKKAQAYSVNEAPDSGMVRLPRAEMAKQSFYSFGGDTSGTGS